MGEIKYITGLVMLVLFSTAILYYAIWFGDDNNAVININQDSDINAMNYTLDNGMEDFRLDTDNASRGFFSTEISAGDDTTRSGGQFKLGFKSLKDSFSAITDATNNKLFGGSPQFAIVLTALISLMVYIGFRYIWKTWKGGNPD
jgi:hypothetical protein